MLRFARVLGVLSLVAILGAGFQPATASAADEAGALPRVEATTRMGLDALALPSSGPSWQSVTAHCPGMMGLRSSFDCSDTLSAGSSCDCPSMATLAPTSLGGFGFGRPWWAGMPLWAISANSGGTWPWAPWYYTPQWWLAVALANSR
jgi:hypothetical protein